MQRTMTTTSATTTPPGCISEGQADLGARALGRLRLWARRLFNAAPGGSGKALHECAVAKRTKAPPTWSVLDSGGLQLWEATVLP